MTYADVTLTPGPTLNLLCAPNGTGKSTIACALCIGLGFAPKLLGRADNVKDFIRRGQNCGWVQISLSEGDGRRDFVVKRTIECGQDAVRGTSTWFLNGIQILERDIKQRIASFNFQLDNLCQFLPQDKVVEFARLGPEDLLRETEKAIGQSELLGQHVKLIEQRRHMLETDREAGVVERKLQEAEEQLANMERDAERFERRQQLLDEANWLRKKSFWIQFERQQEAYRQSKQQHDEAVNEFKQMETRVKGEQAPIREAKKLIVDIQSKKRQIGTQLNQAENQMQDECMGRVDELQVTIERAAADLRNLDQQSQQYRRNIEQLTKDVEDYQQRLKGLDEQAQNKQDQEQLNKLHQDSVEIDQQLNGVESQKQNHEENRSSLARQSMDYQRRLRELDDTKIKKLKQLEKSCPGIQQTYNIIQKAQNEGKFQQQVLGPILLEVTVQDRLHASYLESACPFNLWSSFVTGCRADQDTLARLFSGEYEKIFPNIICFTGNPNLPLKKQLDPQKIEPRFGIQGTLDEVCQASSIIKHVICEEAGINFAYIGNENTDNCISQFFDRYHQISRVLTPTQTYSRKRSMYNINTCSTLRKPRLEARLLVPGTATDENHVREDLTSHINRIQGMMHEIKQKVEELDLKQSALQQEKQGITAQQKQIRNKQNERRKNRSAMQQNLQSRKRELRRLQNEPDPIERLQEIQERQEHDSRELVNSLGALVDKQQECWDLFKQLRAAALSEKETSCILQAKEQAAENNQQLLQMAQANVNLLNQQMRQRREQCKQAKTAATRECELTDEAKAKFENLPNDLDEVRLLAEEKAAQADGIICNDEQVLIRYQQLQKQVQEYRDQVASGQDRKETAQQRLNVLRDEWLERLKMQVGIVNDTFKNSFAEIGCAGEIQVFEHPGEDFEKYGIQIKVQFRECEEAEVLSATRQSGGERSVATMLYLLSLQSITNCPFRVVDEINQGMDPINERKVFDLLVSSSLRPDTPQCFLLTPKLLPDMGIKEGVTCLMIFNGMQASGANFVNANNTSIRSLVMPQT